VKPFAYVDANNNTVAFADGILSTVGPVTLTPTAEANLASKLLQHATQNMVSVRREYVPASEYGGLHG
jgi:hypothetical protein